MFKSSTLIVLMVCMWARTTDAGLCANINKSLSPEQSQCDSDQACLDKYPSSAKTKCCVTPGGGSVCRKPAKNCANRDCADYGYTNGEVCVVENGQAACKPVPSAAEGSCKGSCGGEVRFGDGKLDALWCSCDASCQENGNCCGDFEQQCSFIINPTVKAGYCRDSIPDFTKVDKCSVDDQCEGTKKCCLSNGGYMVCRLPARLCTQMTCPDNLQCFDKDNVYAEGTEDEAKYKKPTCLQSLITAGCTGYCGGYSDTGACYCDSICESMNDCCTDYQQVCAANNPGY